MANPTIQDYIKTDSYSADVSGSGSSASIVIPVAAIGLDNANDEAADVGEFLNALLRTVVTNYDGQTTKPEHMTPTKSTYVPNSGYAERSYNVRLDIVFGDESVVDEASA